MRSITAADGKNNFGKLIDLARAAPVAVTKYDRPVVVVMAVEEYERLTANDAVEATPAVEKGSGTRPGAASKTRLPTSRKDRRCSD